MRKGTANIFVAVEPKGCRRITDVTEHRKKSDYAHFVERIVNAYPEATTVHVVQDNLNTHFLPSLIAAFGLEKASRLWSRITPHSTPKHASWLNMAEIEINAISAQCLNRRISSLEELDREVKACTEKHNADRRTIRWKYTKEKARNDFPILYAKTS